MSLPFARASFPEIYEQALVEPLFRPWAGPLLEDAGLRPGDRVLDVACGTGIVARSAAAKLAHGAQVVGVDAAAPMIEVARRAAPRIDWRVGDAAALPLQAGEQFDVVVCQQGMQFFAERAAAAREMRRALAPGGRLAASTWRPDEELPVLLELRHIAERHLGPLADRRHSFGEPQQLESLLRDAGLRNVRSKIVSRTIRFSDGALFVRLNAMALLAMGKGPAPASEAEREGLLEAIGRDSAAVVKANGGAAGFAYELRAVVATAQA